MVEIDPLRPDQPPVKHCWLGRFRHEAVSVKALAGQPLFVYSGCDSDGGHLYRYVSSEPVRDPADPANSILLEQGRLQAAVFNADGMGRWVELAAETPLAPLRPSNYESFGLSQDCLLPHRDRNQAGAEALATDAELEAYLQSHNNLADLFFSFKESYASNLSWVMNRATHGKLYKVKDSQGIPLLSSFQQGTFSNSPSYQMFGVPVNYVEYMPASGVAAARSILIGDFQEYYLLVRQGFTVIIDDMSKQGDNLIRLNYKYRIGGAVRDASAFASIKEAVS